MIIITDRVCNTITMTMKKNTSLTIILMSNSPISGECAQLIVQAFQHSSSLWELCISYMYTEDDKKRIRLSANEIIRKSRIREFKSYDENTYLTIYLTVLKSINSCYIATSYWYLHFILLQLMFNFIPWFRSVREGGSIYPVALLSPA